MVHQERGKVAAFHSCGFCFVEESLVSIGLIQVGVVGIAAQVEWFVFGDIGLFG